MRLLLAILIASPLAYGCALAGRRGPSTAEVAVGRELGLQGQAAFEAGRWDEAERLLKDAIEKSPADAASHRTLAETLWRRGAYAEAIAHIDAAVKASPTDAELAVRAGEMRLTTESFEAAVTMADEAIRRDPKSPAAWALRGRAHQQLMQTERALADFQRALEFQPHDRNLLAEVAGIYQQIGQPTRKLTTLRQLIATYPPGQAPQQLLIWEGATLCDLGRHDQAVEALSAANSSGPANIEARFQLARAYAAAGHIEAAASMAQLALTQDAAHVASKQLLQQLAERSSETVRR
jgi:tetratricopeptide (TPR) repeat protein